MKGVIWTDVIFNEFIKKAMLSDEEIAVLETSIRGWSRVKQSLELNMSLSKIQRIKRRCEAKYDVAQKESNILPERKRPKNDLFCA